MQEGAEKGGRGEAKITKKPRKNLGFKWWAIQNSNL